MDHGSNELDVHNVSEVSWFIQAVHTLHLHHLTGDLICYLNSIIKKLQYLNILDIKYLQMEDISGIILVKEFFKKSN